MPPANEGRTRWIPAIARDCAVVRLVQRELRLESAPVTASVRDEDQSLEFECPYWESLPAGAGGSTGAASIWHVEVSLDGAAWVGAGRADAPALTFFDPSAVHVTTVGPKKLAPGVEMKVGVRGLSLLGVHPASATAVLGPRVRIGELELAAKLEAEADPGDSARLKDEGALSVVLPTVEAGLPVGDVLVEVSLDGGATFTADGVKAKTVKK